MSPGYDRVARQRALSRRSLGMSGTLLVLGLWATGGWSQPGDSTAVSPVQDAGRVQPPGHVTAGDRPGDRGEAVVLTWQPSPQDTGEEGLVTGYVILRASSFKGDYATVGKVGAGDSRYVDIQLESGQVYFYRVGALAARDTILSEPVGPVHATYQWFNQARSNLLMVGLALCGALLIFIAAARPGRLPALRRLPGLRAIDEGIRRAREEGRPLVFVNGSEDLNNIQTIAGLNVLEQVAARTQGTSATLLVPQFHSLTMAAADDLLHRSRQRESGQETAETFYVSDEQFGYVAGVSGAMTRQKPAAVFYFGSFYAEALALAEVGQSIGALQVAGTGEAAQIPFLLTACDHVLIGEELFAASAYLSGDPRRLGTIRGQDFGKLLALVAILLGSSVATLAGLTGSAFLRELRDALVWVFRSGATGG